MEHLWTTEELGIFLNKTPQWIRENIRTLKIPGIKIGQQWRFNPNEIADWLRTQQ